MDNLDLEFERVIIPRGGKDHSQLQNLDYENSGHRGFASTEQLNATNEKVSTLEEQVQTNASAIQALSEGIDPEKIDGLKEVANYVNEHLDEVLGIQQDISELKGQVNKISGNLLQENISATNKGLEPNIIILDYSLGLYEGKSYKVSGTYGANDTEFEGDTAWTDAIIEGANAITWQPVNAGISITIFDKKIPSGDVLIDSESNAVVLMLVAEEINSPLVLKSITEVEVEYATQESVDELTERVTALEEKPSTPSGEPLVATFKIIEGASTKVTVKNITGATSVDWGDGSAIEDISSATTYTHTYESVGSFVAKFYGVISTVSATFSGNSSIVSAIIPHSVTGISETFRNCTSLLEVKIPNTITWIGAYTFQGCTELTNIEIPNSVTSISMRAFSGCTKLSSVKMPQNDLITFGQDTFYGCPKLTKIELKSTNISNSNNTIFPSTTKIIVPYERLQQYKQALTNHASQIDAYAMASDIGNINTQLANIIEGEGV